MEINKPSYVNYSKIYINNEIRKRVLIVLKSKPCSKIIEGKRCLTCFFDKHSFMSENTNTYIQFKSLKDDLIKKEINHIDLLSTGSILDENQIPYSEIVEIFKEMKKMKNVKSVLIEGRVEYCNIKKLNELKKHLGDKELEYGIGLESFNDLIRNNVLKKELLIEDFKNCIQDLNNNKIRTCTYLLTGIPNLSEEENYKDLSCSLININKLYEEMNIDGRINIYPIFIVKETFLQDMYKNREIVLTKTKKIYNTINKVKKDINLKKYPIFIGIDDEGLSGENFIGNNKEIFEKIEKFNLSQDLKFLK